MKNTLLFILSFSTIMCSCKQGKTPLPEPEIPADKLATVETVALYNRLFALREKGVMVGHQDDLAYGHGWYNESGRSDVKTVTGDYPAVVGWELGHIEIGAEFNLDSVYFSEMKRFVKETYNRGGITTFSWHGDNIATGNTAWDCAQDSVVRSVLPNGANHEQYLVWLDRLAAFFLDLQTESGTLIPVVFRMYHEHTGSWFWWGNRQCTPEEYKQLWHMTVEYLRDRNVHNILYAYSPAETEDEAHYLERYPGDEYVDILAFDFYVQGKDAEALTKYKEIMQRNLEIITQYAEKSGKIATIGETGMESIIDTTYFTQTLYSIISKCPISWTLFWRNAWEGDKTQHFYVPFSGHPAVPDFKKFVAKDNILMNEDIILVR